MSRMINFSGQGLQRAYTETESELSTQEKEMQKSDREALKKYAESQRKAREARQAKRMERNKPITQQVEDFEKNGLSEEEIDGVMDGAMEETNVIARKYGLPQPNNPQALEHDRTHCFTCDRHLDSPNAHKDGDLEKLFDDDKDVRILCCWCFGRMGDDDIKSTIKIEGAEADAKIRLQVYNPMESKKEEIESLTSTRRIFLKSKLKKWEQDTELVGKLTRTLHDEDYQENFNMYNAKTRYDTF